MTMNDGAARVAANVHPQPVAGTIGAQRPGRPGLGWLFLAPALVLLLIQQVIPALRTFVMSLREGTQLFGPEAAWVGLANYQFIAEEGFFRAVVSLGLLGAVLAVLGFVVGFALGLPARRSRGTARRVGLAMAGVALVFVAPVASMMGMSQWVDLGSAARYSQFLSWVPATVTAGFLVGLLARPPVRAGRVLAFGSAIAAMAGTALSVQFPAEALASTPFGGPVASIYRFGIMQFRTGVGAAGSTVLILVVAVLGVLATRMLLASRLRLRIGGQHEAALRAEVHGHLNFAGDPVGASNPARGGAGAVLGGVVVLLVAAVASAPWLFAAPLAPGDPMPGGWEPPAAGAALLSTWLSGVGEVLLAVVVAALAGVGIGYYRPVGERSLPVLLTVLSPALFLGLVPLMTVHFIDRYDLGWFGTPLGAIHPYLVVVPLVFLCAYLADAVRVSNKISRVSRRTAMAGIGLAAGVLVLLRSESVWPLILAQPGRDTALRAWQLNMVPEALAVLKPWPALVLLAAIVAVCAIGIRRLRLGHVEPQTVGIGAGPAAGFAGYPPPAPGQTAYGPTPPAPFAQQPHPGPSYQHPPHPGPPHPHHPYGNAPPAPGGAPQQQPFHRPPPQGF